MINNTGDFWREKVKLNWRSGLTVALISVPLSIALSIASGAGPLPGLIAGIWGALIGSFFIGSNYNIIGAAGAITTVLFGATLMAPMGLGADVLPLIALFTGAIIFIVWLLRLDRLLYFVPSSVMFGFAGGVAILIAASQLFDATGLIDVSRTGNLFSDIQVFIENISSVHMPSLVAFAVFLSLILVWKKFISKVPAIAGVALIGILVGYFEAEFFNIGLESLEDKFGAFSATLMIPVIWGALPDILSNREHLLWILNISGVIALITILETLISEKIADKMTKTQSSSARELLGLSLSNFGSGAMGGLPASGLLLRTAVNVESGATHRTSGMLSAIFTALIILLTLPLLMYIPMVVIAALLVNTALGLFNVEKFTEYWKHEKESFAIAIIVVVVTIFYDAGLAVAAGVSVAILLFVRRVARGRFDMIWNFSDGTLEEVRGVKFLELPKTKKQITVVTYSIAGNLGYIDASQHLNNLRKLASVPGLPVVIIRLRALFSIDFEGAEALAEAVDDLREAGIKVYISSATPVVETDLLTFPIFQELKEKGFFTLKTKEALKKVGIDRY